MCINRVIQKGVNNMKKILKTLTTAFVAASFVPAIAMAQVTVTNTGPGSTVTVTDSSDCTINVQNSTTITGTNTNNQNTSSGNATTNNNTSGGSASSGSSSSSNTVTIDFSVNNGTAGTTAAGDPCEFETVSAPTEVPVDNPGGSGGSGGGTVNGTSTTNGGGAGAGVAALPDTGIEDVLPAISIAAGVIAVAAIASRFAIKAFAVESIKE